METHKQSESDRLLNCLLSQLKRLFFYGVLCIGCIYVYVYIYLYLYYPFTIPPRLSNLGHAQSNRLCFGLTVWQSADSITATTQPHSHSTARFLSPRTRPGRAAGRLGLVRRYCNIMPLHTHHTPQYKSKHYDHGYTYASMRIMSIMPWFYALHWHF